jgi:hypothetical protein
MEKPAKTCRDIFMPPVVVPVFLAVSLMIWLMIKPHLG